MNIFLNLYCYLDLAFCYGDVTWREMFNATCHVVASKCRSYLSMVRASHRRSEDCGFDSRLGLGNLCFKQSVYLCLNLERERERYGSHTYIGVSQN